MDTVPLVGALATLIRSVSSAELYITDMGCCDIPESNLGITAITLDGVTLFDSAKLSTEKFAEFMPVTDTYFIFGKLLYNELTNNIKL